MATQELKLPAWTPGAPGIRGTRPLTRPLVDALDEGEPGRVPPATASKLKALIAKLSSLLAMVPPELRGKIMALIAQAEAALAGLWIGDLGALVSLMERTIAILNQLLGWGDLRDLRELSSRQYWERRRLWAELSRLLGGVAEAPTDTLSSTREPDALGSLSAMIRARFE